MKKVIISLILLSVILSGCMNNENQTSEKPQVLVSFVVLEAITTMLAEDQVEVINLLPLNADPHSFELDSNDMINLSTIDYLIIVGNDFEHWYDETYPEVKPETAKVLDVSQNISLLNNSLNEIDPHIWTSISNFKQISIDIADYLKTFVDKPELIDENLNRMIERLDLIESETSDLFNDQTKTIFVTQRPAFTYLAQSYGLEMISVTDPGHVSDIDAAHLEEVIQVIKDNDLKIIFYENELEKDVAETLAFETEVETRLLNSFESFDLSGDKDIIDLMRDNIINLAEAIK